MFRSILVIIIFLSGILLSCNNDCEENAPTPLSFKIQWVNNAGQDMYFNKTYIIDSLRGYYKKPRFETEVIVPMKAVKNLKDTSQYYVDMMPLIRVALSLQLDSVFIAPERGDVDTIVFKLIKEKNDCYSSIYRFETLEYNGKSLINGIDSPYKIVK